MHLAAEYQNQEVSVSEQKKQELVPSFPHLVFVELLAIMAVLLFFVLISIYYNAPLEEMANPSNTPNPAKAPWYFVGLQELLTYFDPWFGGVVAPVLIILGLMAIPFFTRQRQVNQMTDRRYKIVAFSIFTAGLALWFILIVIGQYFRGPSWQLYWPWESWAVEKETNENLWNFHYLLGAVSLTSYFVLALIVPALKWREFFRRLGVVRYSVFVFLLAMFGGVILKIMLRVVLGVKYVLVTPWFNI